MTISLHSDDPISHCGHRNKYTFLVIAIENTKKQTLHINGLWPIRYALIVYGSLKEWKIRMYNNYPVPTSITQAGKRPVIFNYLMHFLVNNKIKETKISTQNLLAKYNMEIN